MRDAAEDDVRVTGKPIRPLKFAGCLLASAIGGYVLSYIVLVQGEPDPLAPLLSKNPVYRCGGLFAEAVYLPIHEIDRRLRPDYWGRWNDNVVRFPIQTDFFGMIGTYDGFLAYCDLLVISLRFELSK